MHLDLTSKICMLTKFLKFYDICHKICCLNTIYKMILDNNNKKIKCFLIVKLQIFHFYANLYLAIASLCYTVTFKDYLLLLVKYTFFFQVRQYQPVKYGVFPLLPLSRHRLSMLI